MRKAHFFDLGGTLLRLDGNDQIYQSPEGSVALLPHVKDVLQKLKAETIFIVTNQSGIEQGFVSPDDVVDWVRQVEKECDIRIADFWACPRKRSLYRKPEAGMLLGLADKHFIDLVDSIFVGDSETDFQAAKAAGMRQIFHAKRFFGWEERAPSREA